ncbi:TSUP family transporter [Permianibacter sp. IMCC34836]|uniref:TSUP family transporter n=1 Tax=Permianibacter fluminis TaxID=2738515 RepID=UPI0015575914|nr:TSUP family transporter [Permianibacter fluminis]NQD38567.1 TSUP family transporter [Permianibacter fluminis]
MLEFSTEILTLLFFVAVVAGCIDAIAGGGGLLTIPALLWAGLPPAIALGTNKLQGCAGSFSASLHFIREKAVDFRRFWPAFLASLIGGALGALTVQQIDPGFLRKVIPWLLIGIALYMLLAKRVGEVESHQRISLTWFALTIGFGIGYYDGFFGPGTGTFFALGCVTLLGLTLPVATAHSKVLNFASNFASLCFFVIGGKVLWLPGGVMAAGQFIGGQIGARLVFKGGAKLVRVVLVVMSVALSIRLFMTS